MRIIQKKTTNQREALAVKMRHSPQIAARAYFKIKTDDKTTRSDDNEIIKELKQTIQSLNIQVNELKSKLLKEGIKKFKIRCLK